MSDPLSYLADELQDLRERGLFRWPRRLDGPQEPVARYDGKEVINLCSNNYLGLANHPTLKEAAGRALDELGVGSGAVRTIAGNMALHLEVEEEFARFKQTEATLLYQSGFTANAGTVSAVLGKDDVIVSDELNHASIIDGAAPPGGGGEHAGGEAVEGLRLPGRVRGGEPDAGGLPHPPGPAAAVQHFASAVRGGDGAGRRTPRAGASRDHRAALGQHAVLQAGPHGPRVQHGPERDPDHARHHGRRAQGHGAVGPALRRGRLRARHRLPHRSAGTGACPYDRDRGSHQGTPPAGARRVCPGGAGPAPRLMKTFATLLSPREAREAFTRAYTPRPQGM